MKIRLQNSRTIVVYLCLISVENANADVSKVIALIFWALLE